MSDISDLSTTNHVHQTTPNSPLYDRYQNGHLVPFFLEFWLSTAGSQVFLMQLGFLCYESGFVKSIWSPSVILKNIEDTFVGIAVYCLFSYSLICGESLYGIIGIPSNIFLIGIEPHDHLKVFIGCVFATTCSSLISGAVLERMKNKAYITWCILVLLLNYPFVAHWVWNPNGWLSLMGFIDGAGSIVVHSTGGAAAAIAIWQLGARRNNTNPDGSLQPIESATQPNIHAIGAFILWYGWFAFNLSAPISHYNGPDVEAIVEKTALLTLIAPTCAACASLLLMHRDIVPLRFTDLLGAILGGLVSITACCSTVDLWSAAIIGFLASPLYFITTRIVRTNLIWDDPLHVIAIHLVCGLYGAIMEGIFASKEAISPGLIYGGFEHFGVQLLGTFTCLAFNLIVGILLWYIMKKCFFHSSSIRVSILDTYLGVPMSTLDSDTALVELLLCDSNLAKYMIWQFHKYTKDRFNDEMLDFLCVINLFREKVFYGSSEKSGKCLRIVSYVLKITDAFVTMESKNCVNVSGTVRSQIVKTYKRLKLELEELNKIEEGSVSESEALQMDDENESSEINENKQLIISNCTSNTTMSNYAPQENGATQQRSALLTSNLIDETFFDLAYNDVFYSLLPVFNKFLVGFDSKKPKSKCALKIPFRLMEEHWILQWDQTLEKESTILSRISTNSAL